MGNKNKDEEKSKGKCGGKNIQAQQDTPKSGRRRVQIPEGKQEDTPARHQRAMLELSGFLPTDPTKPGKFTH